jgi:hypothetical protein
MTTEAPKSKKHQPHHCRDCNTDIRQDRFGDHLFKNHKEGIKNHIIKIGKTIVPLEYQYQFLCLVCEKVFTTKKKALSHMESNTDCSLEHQTRLANGLLGKGPLSPLVGETVGENDFLPVEGLKILPKPQFSQNYEIDNFSQKTISPKVSPTILPKSPSTVFVEVCEGCGEWEEMYEKDLSEAQTIISKQQEELEILTREINRLWAKYPNEVHRDD